MNQFIWHIEVSRNTIVAIFRSARFKRYALKMQTKRLIAKDRQLDGRVV